MDAPTSLWIVLDPKSGPEFAAAWREGAHEHIKDCLDEGIHEASRWVVREYTPIAEVERLRAEVEALKLQRAAAELVHRETATTVLMQMREAEALRADAQRLDCGQIMIDTFDEFGEPKQVWHTGMNLRAAIDAARAAQEK